MYRADTTKRDLQPTGTPTPPPHQRASYLTRSSSCTLAGHGPAWDRSFLLEPVSVLRGGGGSHPPLHSWCG
jgi:hypothetical protein